MAHVERMRARDLGPLLLNDYAWELRPRLDWSTGNEVPPPSVWSEEWFLSRLADKLGGIHRTFRKSVKAVGIQHPIEVVFCTRDLDEDGAEGPGRPTLYEGHHRFAWAWFNDTEVPVLFCADQQDRMSSRTKAYPADLPWACGG